MTSEIKDGNADSAVEEDDCGNTPRRKNMVREPDGDERIVLNVGGVRHETHVHTLRTIPNTRLSRLAEAHLQAQDEIVEYFFDRHPAVFNAVIDFYRTGELHVPLEVCGAVVKRELDFWQIHELDIRACCWRHYRSYIENQRILDNFNDSLRKENLKVDMSVLKGWKYWQMYFWLILDHPRTSRAAMLYGITSFLFVTLSIAGFCLETLPGLRPSLKNVTNISCNGEEPNPDLVMQVLTTHTALFTIDLICTVWFTLELVARFIFAPIKFKFIFSPMNIVDLLALVPLYVQVTFTISDMGACYLNEQFVIEIMFILRIIRMFRIFHLVKHYQALKVLVYALKASLQELLMLFIFLMIAMLVFATMIYYAERKDATTPGDTFNTIPIGFWWAIITMTTVGYGDVTPQSPVGYVVGTGCAVCGVLLVALTFPVISNNFTLFYTHVRSKADAPRPIDDLVDDDSDSEGSSRKHSADSTLLETFMNGKVNGRGGGGGVCRKAPSPVYVPIARFSEANSMTDIVLENSASDYSVITKTQLASRARSCGDVAYHGETIL